MSFQAPLNQPDFSKLETTLINSKTNVENPALYQTILQLIRAIQQMQSLFVSGLADAGSGSGVVGKDGIPGINGIDGTDGEDGFFTFGAPGPKGSTGPAGSTGIAIPGADGIDGIDGIDGLSIVGPAGSPGSAGAAGPTGSVGPQGLEGLDGLDGMDGLSIVGPTGPQGIPGISGPIGPMGFDGYDGNDGYDGFSIVGPPGPSGGGSNTGTATLDFGAFPGASDASIAVTGQAAIVAGSIVQAWLRPEDTADHKADEHMVETMQVFAGNIVAGTGFTIYGFNYSQMNEPVVPALFSETTIVQATASTIVSKLAQFGGQGQLNLGGGKGTRIYGTWKVAWRWS
jgi:hypothetical protein